MIIIDNYFDDVLAGFMDQISGYVKYVVIACGVVAGFALPFFAVNFVARLLRKNFTVITDASVSGRSTTTTTTRVNKSVKVNHVISRKSKKRKSGFWSGFVKVCKSQGFFRSIYYLFLPLIHKFRYNRDKKLDLRLDNSQIAKDFKANNQYKSVNGFTQPTNLDHDPLLDIEADDNFD